ncbi:hypothetical protein BDN70DRAFT_979533, partial [Pholiota conissans]
LAIIINWALFGVLSIQVYLYSQVFPNDRPMLKALVIGIYIMETVQTFLLTQTIWKMLVQGFGDIEGTDEVGTTFFSVCFIGGLVGFLVQLFYSWRIAIISQKRLIPGLIVIISLISFGGALATTINSKRYSKFSELLDDNQSLAFTLWSGAGSVCDVVIAFCMCYYLRKRKGSFSQTQALVSRLVAMTIETGVLTASISILSLALYYSPRLKNFSYFEVPLSTQGKLYSTTMLAVLNSRIKAKVATESTAWRDEELVFTTLPPRDTNMLRLHISSLHASPSGDVFGANKFDTTATEVSHLFLEPRIN